MISIFSDIETCESLLSDILGPTFPASEDLDPESFAWFIDQVIEGGSGLHMSLEHKRGRSGYLQLLIAHDHMHVEVRGNESMCHAIVDRLTADEERDLKRMGWHAPTGHRSGEARKFEGGSPNWSQEFQLPLDTHERLAPAGLFYATMRLLYQDLKPSRWTVRTFRRPHVALVRSKLSQ